MPKSDQDTKRKCIRWLLEQNMEVSLPHRGRNGRQLRNFMTNQQKESTEKLPVGPKPKQTEEVAKKLLVDMDRVVRNIGSAQKRGEDATLLTAHLTRLANSSFRIEWSRELLPLASQLLSLFF